MTNRASAGAARVQVRPRAGRDSGPSRGFPLSQRRVHPLPPSRGSAFPAAGLPAPAEPGLRSKRRAPGMMCPGPSTGARPGCPEGLGCGSTGSGECLGCPHPRPLSRKRERGEFDRAPAGAAHAVIPTERLRRTGPADVDRSDRGIRHTLRETPGCGGVSRAAGPGVYARLRVRANDSLPCCVCGSGAGWRGVWRIPQSLPSIVCGRALRGRSIGMTNRASAGAARVQVKPRAGRDSGPSRGFGGFTRSRRAGASFKAARPWHDVPGAEYRCSAGLS
jgi:hypothetical protein